MNTKLYHKDIFIPAGLSFPKGQFPVNHTGHAVHASQTDRYGKFNLPATIHTDYCEVIEVEVTGNKVTKIVYRFATSSKYHMCAVVRPDRFGYNLITAWLNDSNDSHKTLDVSKYDQN